ncbi:MAG: hypothetical protein F9K30_00580 [Dechloromonas sp.]|nr:MAG: hypothetical protein F9K30_00580 [Dechloromonas sp.]
MHTESSAPMLALKRRVRRFRAWRLAAGHALGSLRRLGNGPALLADLRFPNLLLPPVIHVAPQRIDYICSVSAKPACGCPLFIGGDWDQRMLPTLVAEAESPKFLSCRELLVDGLAPEETSEYRFIMAAIARHGSYRGCVDADDARAHIEARLAFYRRVAEGGYRRQSALGESGLIGEIECAVDRDGQLVKINAGNHRLAVARLLGLPAIPVHLTMIHESWRPGLTVSGGLASLSRVRAFIADIEAAHRLPAAR